MGLIDEFKTNVNNMSGPSGNLIATKAEQGFAKAQESTKEALLSLAKTVYENEKDNKDSVYAEDIKILGDCLEKEKLWQLYSLSLDEKTMCESCGAVITADSVFCNKCGASVPERDFTAIGIGSTAPAEDRSNANVCPKCGASLATGAEFCEKCGTKIERASGQTGDVAASQIKQNVCPRCGASLLEGAVFCEKCGSKLSYL